MSLNVQTVNHMQRLFVLTDMSRVTLSGSGSMYFQQSVDRSDGWSNGYLYSPGSTTIRSPSWHGVTAPLAGLFSFSRSFCFFFRVCFFNCYCYCSFLRRSLLSLVAFFCCLLT